MDVNPSSMRHGTPVQISGWVTKEGRLLRSKHRRYLKLRGSILSNHHSENSPASWEVSVVERPVSSGSKRNELVIPLPTRRVSFFVENDREFTKWMEALKKAASNSVTDFYRIEDKIGEGSFAKVMLCYDRETNEKFAMKIIEKKGFNSREMELIKREMNIMKSICHPSIVSTYDIFDGKTSIHIVLEFMEGGELFDVIATSGSFSEMNAQRIMRDILQGIAYLHTHSIVHRDIKPENVLCKSSKSFPLTVKIADLGLAGFLGESGEMSERNQQQMIGTAAYVAPEIVRKEPYGAGVDVWASGVLLYIMLTGKMPFYGNDESEVLKMILDGEVDYSLPEFEPISESAKSLLRSLLQKDPNRRLTAQAALNHRWIEDSSIVSDAPLGNDYSNLHSSRRKFRRAVIAVASLKKMSMLRMATANAVASGAFSTVSSSSITSEQQPKTNPS